MKTLIFTRKVMAIFIMAIFSLFSSKMIAQTIQIDSLFTSDGEIFPFGENDTIYGLSISGSVNLISETSLVRVILTDYSGNEWMVYEAYPMIVQDSAFEFNEECDETCYLEEFHPLSLKIQIIDAEIIINELSYSTIRYENLPELQQQAKRSKDLEKIQLMNQYIFAKNWDWIADTNDLVNMYYHNKANIFNHGYNLLGRDFYSGGSYYSVLHENIPHYDDRSIIASFDWREKHYACNPNSPYYRSDGESPCNGWLTGIRHQGDCWSCSAFACIAELEAAINLYSNYQFDIEEGNVRFSEKDAFNCSYYAGHQGCDCDHGKPVSAILDKIKNHGVVNEECFPYEQPYCEFSNGTCDENSSICDNPNWIASICGRQAANFDMEEDPAVRANFLKELLLINGPIPVALHIYNPAYEEVFHAVLLIGFEFNENTGKIDWIYKNSQGPGFYKEPLWLGPYPHPPNPSPNDQFPTHIENPIIFINYSDTNCPNPISIESNINPQFEYTVHENDFDKDGYYNWGIGHCPSTYICSQDEDSNDDDNSIGPFLEDYSGELVKPIVNVQIGVGAFGSSINDGDIIYLNQGNNAEDIVYPFEIKNTGNAQLNLARFNLTDRGNVSIENQDPQGSFEIELSDMPDTSVCWSEGSNITTFNITLKANVQPGAVAHMHIYFETDQDLDPVFEFTLVYSGCETLPGSYTINTPVYWDEPYMSQLQDVNIKNNGELRVTGTVFLSSEVDIIVERGGKLIIDGGTLTASCGNLWNGVDIWGNASMPQEPYYQGTVELMNGGTIEFADTAISTYRSDGGSLIYSGGLIFSTDAFLKNNYVGICLYPYTNPSGGGNRSTFKRTQFITTDNYYQPGNAVRSAPKCGAQLSWVNGLNFEGCTFINDSKAEKRKRGCGILNMDADFHVKNACEDDNQIGCEPTIPSKFIGLDYGIKSLNVWSFRRISVESADFIDNMRSIYLSMNLDASLIKNNFELNADNEFFKPGDTLIGIYSDACSRYQIEKNNFIGDDPDHFELVGMHILNSGEEYNEIYDNFFENLDYGIVAAGKNKNKDGSSGLCIKCNDFTKCGIDVFVTSAGYDSRLAGIATNQGVKNKPPAAEPDLAAGNTFSEFIDDENNYWNDNSLTTLQYVHHYIGSTDEKVRPNPYTNITPDEDPDAAYSKDSSCPSNLQREGLILSEEQSKFNLENSAVLSQEDSLDLIIDAGDTPGLNFEIMSSYPDEALQLHQELMDISPYLSDTIIKSAIERENVLLNAMIRDVLVANPQAAKTPQILEKLDDRLDPIPDYMMDEIIAGQQYYGAKELALQDLAGHKERMAKSLSNIVWLIKQDTLASQVSDSIIVLLESVEQIKTKYETAFLSLSKEDTVSAYTTLNDIPQQFTLDVQMLNEHESYLELFDVLPAILADSCIIDSVLIQRLFNIADYDNSLPGIYSRNLLEAKGFLSYEEPLYLNNVSLKDYSIASSNKGFNDAKSPYLEIFPNPSNSFFIIKYDLREFDAPGTILISDQTGKILFLIPLNDSQNQKILETNTFSSGMHLVSLYVNDKLKAKAKLIIQ